MNIEFKVNPSTLLKNASSSNLKINDSAIRKGIRANFADLMSKTRILNISLLHKYSEVPISVLSDILNGKTENPNLKTLHKLAS